MHIYTHSGICGYEHVCPEACECALCVRDHAVQMCTSYIVADLWGWLMDSDLTAHLMAKSMLR